MNRTILPLLAAASLAFAARASIVSTAGQTTWLASPPASAWLGALTAAWAVTALLNWEAEAYRVNLAGSGEH